MTYFLRIMKTPLTSESPAVHSPPAHYFQLTSVPTAAEAATTTIDTPLPYYRSLYQAFHGRNYQ